MKKLTKTLTLLFCSTTILATPQLKDQFIYNNKKFHILEQPYKPILTQNNKTFKSYSSNNLRGYQATWTIKQGKLFLIRLTHPYKINAKSETKSTFASWYTGSIKVVSERTTTEKKSLLKKLIQYEVVKGIIKNIQ